MNQRTIAEDLQTPNLTPNQTPHLTDAQFSEAVLGEALAPDAQRHAETCMACGTELEQFGVAIADLRMASRNWSQARNEAMPSVRPAAQRRPGVFGRFAPAYAWAAAGLLAVGVTVPLVEHEWHPRTAESKVAASEQADGMNSPEQIARDNQLMAEVHFELTRTDLLQTTSPSGTSGFRQSGALRNGAGREDREP